MSEDRFKNISEKERDEILKKYEQKKKAVEQRKQLMNQVLITAISTAVSFVILRMLRGD